MDWLSEKIDNVLSWIVQLVRDVWQSVIDWLSDFVVGIFESVLTTISGWIAAIPVPSFMAAGGLQSLVNMLPSSILWFLGQVGFVESLAIISAGIAFNLLRKIFTFGQW